MIMVTIMKNFSRGDLTWEEEIMYFSPDEIRKIQPVDAEKCVIFTASSEEYVVKGSAEAILGQWLDADKQRRK